MALESYPPWHYITGNSERGEKCQKDLSETMPEDRINNELHLPSLHLLSVNKSTKRQCLEIVGQRSQTIFSLVPSIATGFFYATKANGGLGLPRFEYIIKFGTLKTAINLKNSVDPAEASLISDGEELQLKKIANSLRINCPGTCEDIEKARKRLKREHIKQLSELRSQGHRIKDFSREKLGNVWLKYSGTRR